MEQSTLTQLFKLAKMYVQSNEPLSRVYLRQFIRFAKNNAIVVGDDFKTQFCESCEQLYVPGENCDVRLMPRAMVRLQQRQQAKGRGSGGHGGSNQRYSNFDWCEHHNKRRNLHYVNHVRGKPKYVIVYTCRGCNCATLFSGDESPSATLEENVVFVTLHGDDSGRCVSKSKGQQQHYSFFRRPERQSDISTPSNSTVTAAAAAAAGGGGGGASKNRKRSRDQAEDAESRKASSSKKMKKKNKSKSRKHDKKENKGSASSWLSSLGIK